MQHNFLYALCLASCRNSISENRAIERSRRHFALSFRAVVSCGEEGPQGLRRSLRRFLANGLLPIRAQVHDHLQPLKARRCAHELARSQLFFHGAEWKEGNTVTFEGHDLQAL